MSDIFTDLAAVMAGVDHVAKRDKNEHQRFMFRGIDAVVNAVGPVLRKHGVVVVPDVEDVVYDMVQTSTGKPATACRVRARYTFYASDGSHISARVAAEAWDHGDKAAPKAMSVAFRTALLQALALPTDDPDPDSQTYEQAKPPRKRAAAKPPADDGQDDQTKRMFALMRERGLTSREDALAFVSKVLGRKVESRNDLTPADKSRVIRALDGNPGFGGEQP